MSRVSQPRWLIIFVTIVTLYTGGVAFADWEVGQPALYYQLPDPTGWDVYSEWRYGAADDWTADIDAPITDIHFWGSWKWDVVGDMGDLCIQIFDNDTSGSFAKPGNQLWEGVFSNDDSDPGNNYTTRLYTQGDQGWYDPRGTDDWDRHNHDDMYQYNISTVDNPFLQEEDQTYWLQISTNYEGCQWGWKTSTDVSGNSSVFWDKYGHHGWNWQQLKEPAGWCYPRTPEPMDLAFVLTTPEPTTLFLLAAGAAVALRRRRK